MSNNWAGNVIVPRNISATLRRREAMNLRVQGLTYRQVYEAMVAKFGDMLPDSYDERNCYKDVSFEMGRLKKENLETAQELRMLMAERLDQLLMVAMNAALKGDLKAIDRALRIEDQRAKMFGLYAPSQVKLNDWRTEILDLIKQGKITREQAEEELGKDTIGELLDPGSTSVIEGSYTQEEGSESDN